MWSNDEDRRAALWREEQARQDAWLAAHEPKGDARARRDLYAAWEAFFRWLAERRRR